MSFLSIVRNQVHEHWQTHPQSIRGAVHRGVRREQARGGATRLARQHRH